MLQVGEFTTSSKSSIILNIEDVKFVYENQTIPVGFELHISGYKHSQGKTVILFIEGNANKQECPVSSLWQYVRLRGAFSGPLFTFMDGSPVSRSFFTQQPNLSLIWAGCNTKLYKHIVSA